MFYNLLYAMTFCITHQPAYCLRLTDYKKMSHCSYLSFFTQVSCNVKIVYSILYAIYGQQINFGCSAFFCYSINFCDCIFLNATYRVPCMQV